MDSVMLNLIENDKYKIEWSGKDHEYDKCFHDNAGNRWDTLEDIPTDIVCGKTRNFIKHLFDFTDIDKTDIMIEMFLYKDLDNQFTTLFNVEFYAYPL